MASGLDNFEAGRLFLEHREPSLLDSVLELAADLWTEEFGHWRDDHYSTSHNAFIWMAESIFCDRNKAELLGRQPRALPRAGYVKKPIPASIRWAVWERDDFRCRHCGTRSDLTVDHIIPESAGGSMDMDNLQTLCKPCNSRKGTRQDRDA